MKYDYIIFTTMPWTSENIAKLLRVAYLANLTVAIEAPPLEEQVGAKTEEERNFLYHRCNVKENTNITWFHHCKVPGISGMTILGYSWQAEFRAYHIWTHPALAHYRYMMWIDSDAGVTKKWDIDPFQTMEKNGLAILYAGHPYGTGRDDRNHSLKNKLMAVYNTSICGVGNAPHPNGGKHLYAKTCNGGGARFSMIAGNHHVTDLDVFRKDVHQRFLKIFTGDFRFNRGADDQAAVTIVSLMEQYFVNNRTDLPKISIVWHEGTHGMPLKISHHGMYDANRSDKARRRKDALYKELKGSWAGLEARCGDTFAKKLVP